MPEDHFAREASDHDALNDLADFAGLLQGRVPFAVAGVFEFGSNLHTTGRDVEVVEADSRDLRGSAAPVGKPGASANDAGACNSPGKECGGVDAPRPP